MPSDSLISNLLDGLSTLRTGMENVLCLNKEHTSTTDAIFERNNAVMRHNLSMRSDLEHLNGGSPSLWRSPHLLPKVLRRMQLEEASLETRAKEESDRARKEQELRDILEPKREGPTSVANLLSR